MHVYDIAHILIFCIAEVATDRNDYKQKKDSVKKLMVFLCINNIYSSKIDAVSVAVNISSSLFYNTFSACTTFNI